MLLGLGERLGPVKKAVTEWLLLLEEAMENERNAASTQPEMIEQALLKALQVAESALHVASSAAAILSLQKDVWEALKQLWKILLSPQPAYDNPELLSLMHFTWQQAVTMSPQVERTVPCIVSADCLI